jgi:flagellar motor switch/type III secretory pathway protein FliN
MSSSPTLSSSTDSTERPVQALEAADPLAPLFDVRCNVDVIIGTGVLTLRECLTLQRQQVIKLAELAGGDLSIRVQGVTMASGEVVVVDNAAALRVTRVAPPEGVEVS